MIYIPNVIENLTFPALRKSPRIKNCKRPNIKSIWDRLQFLIPGVLARSKCELLNHVRYKLAIFFFMLFTAHLGALANFQQTEDLPVAWNGRFCSMDSASRLWLYDFYHNQKIKDQDLAAFHLDSSSALNLLWEIHFHGHLPWDDSPLFWIHYADLKAALSLDSTKERFRFNLLSQKTPSLPEGRVLDEWRQLSDRLHTFASYRGGFPAEGDVYAKFTTELQNKGLRPEEISRALENRFPLSKRLKNAGTTLKMLPLRSSPGEWVSLHAITLHVYQPEAQRLVPVDNFTAFSDADYERLREAYLALQRASDGQSNESARGFSEAYTNAYRKLAGAPYIWAAEKALYYPSVRQLRAETIYYKIPFTEIAIAFYTLSLLLMLLKRSSRITHFFAMTTVLAGFALHTVVLALRCYILQRPPVSNMFETVVYVPWVALLIGLLFYFVAQSRIVLTTATFTSLALLVLLKLTQVDSRMENVQAVLDSQYWLIIHVLMVVASYGAFAVCGLLGHIYLIKEFNSYKEEATSTETAKGILYTMYAGVALLIPGTILGGVWAAESWGRFWDWDPKESWAFITACVYLLFIHAYTFRKIRNFGLACGAVAGLVAVSFTWYGVNYVLGTGLHSYGFGKGGEKYYFAYLAAECCFLVCFWIQKKRIQPSAISSD